MISTQEFNKLIISFKNQLNTPNFWKLAQRDKNGLIDVIYSELRTIQGSLEDVLVSEELFSTVLNDYSERSNIRLVFTTPKVEVC